MSWYRCAARKLPRLRWDTQSEDYPGWGVELANEIRPVETQLERFVKLDHDFVACLAVAVLARPVYDPENVRLRA